MLLMLGLRAEAEGLPGEAFDQALAAQVFTAAFAFMAPRILDPVPVPQLTAWGLRGITALDPGLIPVLHETDVTLSGPEGRIAVLPLPAAGDLPGWGRLAAAVTASACTHSAALRRAGTAGMVASFFDEVFNHLDPYSRYVAPDAAVADRDRRQGAAGIGVTLVGRPGAVRIASVVAGGPADAAGVRPGERVVAIDGARLGRIGVEAAAMRLAGADGAPVSLTLRGRGDRPTSVQLVRAMVPGDTVSAEQNGATLLLRVSGFTASTADRLRAELATALARHTQPTGLVLDLRGNRGGLLRQAVEAANLMLGHGTIATTDGRNPEAIHRWHATGADLADGLPVVVVVDGRSASAAEVLAAALSDDGRAVVIGSTTLGKGLVQTVTTLPDGGELFVTWSRVLAPKGWPLQGLGVMPELCTSLGEDATTSQLAALNRGSQPMHDVLQTHQSARPGIPLAEMLSIRDACPAALGRDTDLDAATYLITHPIAYATALAAM